MKQTRKIAAAIMAAAMILQAAPLAGLGLTAHAEGEWSKFTKGNTTLGTNGIGSPNAENTIEYWQGSYVYYGKYDGENPTKYRVLAPNTDAFGVEGGSLFLDCDSSLYNAKFDDSSIVWATSSVRSGLQGDAFLEKDGVFTSAEKTAIATSKTNIPEGSTNYYHHINLDANGEQVFLLDVTEVKNTSYGYAGNRARMKKYDTSFDDWWLRSTNFTYTNYVGSVRYTGMLNIDTLQTLNGVSPAFNVDLSSVILSSKVTDVDGDYGDEYKLTLKDPNTTITPGTLTCKSGTVTVPYTVTDSDAEDGITADTVSVLITNANGAVRYYAPLKGDFSANGSGTFDLFADIDETDKIYILAEDVNGQYETDYASELVELDLTPELADGKYMQTAEKDGTYYTRFVFVKPKSEIKGKSKAIFTATYDGKDYPFVTNTYYTGVTTNGVTYTPGSENSVLFVVTVSSGSDISNDLTCELDFE